MGQTGQLQIEKTIGFLGAGNMAEALIRGLLRGHAAASKIAASAPRAERIAELAERYKILVLSVKPQIMRKVLDQIAERLRPDALVISVAAGIPIAAIEGRLRPGTRVVRTMPNTPALVDAAAT